MLLTLNGPVSGLPVSQLHVPMPMSMPMAGDHAHKKRKLDKADRKPRTPSAYNLFVKEEGDRMRQTGQFETQTDLMRELGAAWKRLSPTERLVWENKAKNHEADGDVAIESSSVPEAEEPGILAIDLMCLVLIDLQKKLQNQKRRKRRRPN
eukprot:756737-Hanusia_phi.AAC.3